MLDRRTFVGSVVATLFVACHAAYSQAQKIYRIGVLEAVPASNNTANLDALRRGLRAVGYVYPSRDFVEAGGLIAYAVNYPDLYFQFARYVDKIFKGAKPGDLPVEQPTRFELVINLKTANAFGLTIPQSLLLRADELIR